VSKEAGQKVENVPKMSTSTTEQKALEEKVEQDLEGSIEVKAAEEENEKGLDTVVVQEAVEGNPSVIGSVGNTLMDVLTWWN